jgi:arabinoxylan arabinofuranohydrolase
MNKKRLQVVLSALFLCLSIAANAQTNNTNSWVADNGDGTFSNPVIYADTPDPSVIRVGNVFYMVSTTMHLSPGCTIMKSYDLVNWEMVNYAHDQLDTSDNFVLKNGRNDYAADSWAANLRYDKYEQRYYVIVTCNTTAKSYIFSIADIERGHWHRSVFDKCYDPSFLFEDTGNECKKYIVMHRAQHKDDFNRQFGYRRKSNF